MKKTIVLIMVFMLVMVSGCGSSDNSTTEKNTEAETVNEIITEEEPIDEKVKEYGGIKVRFPDDSWSIGAGMMGAVDLKKADHYYGEDYTMTVYYEDTEMDELIKISTSSDDIFEIEGDGYKLKGYLFKHTSPKTGEVSTNQCMFYPVSDSRTLCINVWLEDHGVKGLDKEDPEVQEIIKSIIELNGLASDDSASYSNDDVIASGTDSRQAEWKIMGDGVLTINCKDGIEGHTNSSEYPWFNYADKVESLVITGEISKIPALAFTGLSNLKSITIPDSIESFSISCFKGCKSLEAIELPSSLNDVDYYIFSGCDSLKEITIPGSIKLINNYDFASCESLSKVVISSGVETISIDVFDGCTSLSTLYLPKSVTKIDDFAFRDAPIKDIYYEGSEEDFAAITIGSNNESLQSANVHYNSY
ncbi:MAG: leucine-rich repeat domain-containing protein [Eubacterium sp.]|nr:leucine-rich repeat domain-containing protein [Eubacterium sp.]